MSFPAARCALSRSTHVIWRAFLPRPAFPLAASGSRTAQSGLSIFTTTDVTSPPPRASRPHHCDIGTATVGVELRRGAVAKGGGGMRIRMEEGMWGRGSVRGGRGCDASIAEGRESVGCGRGAETFAWRGARRGQSTLLA
jgi:hypothetical protein